MKILVKIFAAAFMASVFSLSAHAQKTEDYHKFDDAGYLCEFQLTLPDSTIIKYKHQYNPNGERNNLFADGDYANIIYTDGTVVDFSESYFNGEYYPDKYPALSTIINNPNLSSYKFLTVNDWYKIIRKAPSAPKGIDMIKNMFLLTQFMITFPDNAQLEVCSDLDPASIRFFQYVDCDRNGSSIFWDEGELRSINWQSEAIPFHDMDTDKDISVNCIVSGVQKGYSEYLSPYKIHTQEGTIVMNDGSLFSGTFWVITLYDKPTCALKSEYLKNMLAESTRRHYSFDDIMALVYFDGNVVDKDNNIIGMYRNGKKLDEFDMESLRAAEQGKIAKEKAAAEKAAKEKNAIISKYGKKYADAFFAGKVIVGMPMELVQIGLDAHSFKDFYTALISIDRTSAYGHTQCYSLRGSNYAHVGNMWIRNGVVESITIY